MANLYTRAAKLVIQDLEMVELDIEFAVARNLKPEQNTAEFVIYNLSREKRKHLSEFGDGVVCQLKAGYNGPDPTRSTVGGNEIPTETELPLIFLGALREITHLRNGADWETRISSGDGDGKDRPIKFSLGPGASLTSAIKEVVRELGVGIGNAEQAVLGASFTEGLGAQFQKGMSAFGGGDKLLESLLRSAGKEYSVQLGELQVLDKGQALNTPAVLVSQEFGLVGSPEVGKKGEVKARSLLNAQIYPGRQVRLEAENVVGHYRIEDCSYVGQLNGSDWYVDFSGKPVNQ